MCKDGPLCLANHCSLKVYWGVEVQVHTLTSAVYGGGEVCRRGLGGFGVHLIRVQNGAWLP